jgi:hypothetical protein
VHSTGLQHVVPNVATGQSPAERSHETREGERTSRTKWKQSHGGCEAAVLAGVCPPSQAHGGDAAGLYPVQARTHDRESAEEQAHAAASHHRRTRGHFQRQVKLHCCALELAKRVCLTVCWVCLCLAPPRPLWRALSLPAPLEANVLVVFVGCCGAPGAAEPSLGPWGVPMCGGNARPSFFFLFFHFCFPPSSLLLFSPALNPAHLRSWPPWTPP